MIPIQSAWEYMQAKRVLDCYAEKRGLQGLSERENYEATILMQRVWEYSQRPTRPNIIPATAGNVDKSSTQNAAA